MSLRWYAFLCGLGSDVLLTIDPLRSISCFCQNTHHDWLTKEYISNWFLVKQTNKKQTNKTKQNKTKNASSEWSIWWSRLGRYMWTPEVLTFLYIIFVIFIKRYWTFLLLFLFVCLFLFLFLFSFVESYKVAC